MVHLVPNITGFETRISIETLTRFFIDDLLEGKMSTPFVSNLVNLPMWVQITVSWRLKIQSVGLALG